MATDYDCWHHEAEKVNVANVIKIFKENVSKVKEILLETIKAISKENWDDTIDENKVSIGTCEKKNTIGLNLCNIGTYLFFEMWLYDTYSTTNFEFVFRL